jgi:hypothetical protein
MAGPFRAPGRLKEQAPFGAPVEAEKSRYGHPLKVQAAGSAALVSWWDNTRAPRAMPRGTRASRVRRAAPNGRESDDDEQESALGENGPRTVACQTPAGAETGQKKRAPGSLRTPSLSNMVDQ